MNIAQVNILDVNVHVVNIPQVLKLADNKIQSNSKGYITITGVHGIMESLRSAIVKAAHRDAWMLVPDGMPLVYIGRACGHKNMQRCFGPDLMSALLERSVEMGYKHFFYGGNDGVAQELKEKMELKYPGLMVVGTYTPPFRALNLQEKEELMKMVNELKPDFFWVGLSTPKQELFMQEYLDMLNTRIMLGVGAAFDYHTDRLMPAPGWMQTMALEWFYRLLQEPGRLWKRYVINNPLFLFHLFLQTFGLRKYNCIIDTRKGD
jgi:N-acetylglucosaminyldiphosphoundecaprenol N-acetyl-beta-D-mannosaminyltransferase